MAGLPKGYGSVVKMKGKRIKPYMIRVPDGTYCISTNKQKNAMYSTRS